MISPAGPISPPPPVLPAAWRWTGPFLAAGFGAGVALRRAAYRCGLCQTRRAPQRVISVGNLTVGGTGKTPAAACLARGLLARGHRPAIVLRGYGARVRGGLNDEGRELARALPDVPVIANPDRQAGAYEAAARGCDVVVLDDGFQHWRLARDLDVVLVDATTSLDGAHLLPWGRLREPPGALARADVVILTHCDQAPEAAVEALRGQVARFAPWARLCQARHAPSRFRRLFVAAPRESAARFSFRRVVAACALAHPGTFLETLVRLRAEVSLAWTYPDHHAYTGADLAEWLEQARRLNAAAVVVTEKDASKLEALPAPPLAAPPVWALQIEFQITQGEAELWARIEEALQKAPAR